MLNIDAERLISEVEKRPSIWDVRIKDYSNKVLRKAAWEEIVMEFAGEDADESRIRILEAELPKKWKNIRDQLQRSIRNKPRSGSGFASKSKYLYATQLKFLRDIMLIEEGSDPAAFLETVLDDSSPLKVTHLSTLVKKESITEDYKMNSRDEDHKREAKRRKMTDDETKEEEESEELDDDRSFLLSLLPHLKNVPKPFKIDCRIDLLNSLKKFTSGASLPSNQPSFLPQQNNFPFYHAIPIVPLQHFPSALIGTPPMQNHNSAPIIQSQSTENLTSELSESEANP